MSTTETPAGRTVAFFTSRFGLVTAVTLLLVAVLPPAGGNAVVPAVALVALVAAPAAAGRWWLWAGVLAAAASEPARAGWLALDNHHVGLLWWLAALAVTRLADDPDAALAVAGRALIVVAFAFATVWKAVSGEFVDGSLLVWAATVGVHLGPLLDLVGVQPLEVWAANGAAVDALAAGAAAGPVALEVTPAVAVWVTPAVWATLVAEAAVAVLWAVPLPARWRWWRDAAVGVFAVTWLVLPVAGFGWLVAAWALAGSSLPTRRAGVLYLTLVAAVGVALLLPTLVVA
jgi:hypothetical protein